MNRFAHALAFLAALFLTFGCNKEESSSGTPGGSGASSQSSGGAGGGKKSLVIIPKGTTHVFWQTVNAGAQAAGEERGYKVIFKGPLKEDQAGEQIGIVEQFITEDVAGIALAPLDRRSLVQVVGSAKAKQIPVVIFDSSLEGTPGQDFISYVATDNFKGGSLAGQEMGRLLGGKGKVVLLRYATGSASTEQREAGFLEAIKKFPDIQVISENQQSGATVNSAQTKAMNMIDILKQADGIHTVNESSTQGMLNALDSVGLLGKKKFVGFDTSKSLVDAMKAGKIDALVSQNPRNMGYTAIKTLVDHIEGKPVEAQIDTGVHLVTKANVSTPEIEKLLGSQVK
jgi:ribose transport system substrate-binding protein